ncbi:uncharacterized protein LOC135812691 [Sycon ciliatum]|uniref:uncharacterized protein LOC135812691 n=1 Tax=Sycon ciliatum TaxID=27933 RepID=UPI0031F6AB60
MASDEQFLRDLGLEGEDFIFLKDVNVREDVVLGGGSGTIVYQCDYRGQTAVAKALLPFSLNVPDAERRERLKKFGDEFKRQGTLDHENVVRLHGLARINHMPAIVMEHLGSELEKHAIGSGRRDNATLLGYLGDIAAGLAHLHDNNIIHRDLTLSNILVTHDRQAAKITDVRVSRLLHGSAGEGESARANTKMTDCPGGHLYMAPEAFTGKQFSCKYDTSVDMYAFGVLALSVLTDHMPSYDILWSPRTEVVDGRERDIPDAIRRKKDLARLEESHMLKPFILRCLSNDPAQRPSAAEAEELFREAASVARQTQSALLATYQLTPAPRDELVTRRATHSSQATPTQRAFTRRRRTQAPTADEGHGNGQIDTGHPMVSDKRHRNGNVCAQPPQHKTGINWEPILLTCLLVGITTGMLVFLLNQNNDPGPFAPDIASRQWQPVKLPMLRHQLRGRSVLAPVWDFAKDFMSTFHTDRTRSTIFLGLSVVFRNRLYCVQTDHRLNIFVQYTESDDLTNLTAESFRQVYTAGHAIASAAHATDNGLYIAVFEVDTMRTVILHTIDGENITRFTKDLFPVGLMFVNMLVRDNVMFLCGANIKQHPQRQYSICYALQIHSSGFVTSGIVNACTDLTRLPLLPHIRQPKRLISLNNDIYLIASSHDAECEDATKRVQYERLVYKFHMDEADVSTACWTQVEVEHDVPTVIGSTTLTFGDHQIVCKESDRDTHVGKCHSAHPGSGRVTELPAIPAPVLQPIQLRIYKQHLVASGLVVSDKKSSSIQMFSLGLTEKHSRGKVHL